MKAKFLFIFIAILIIAEIGFFAWANYPTTLQFKILPTQAAATVPLFAFIGFVFLEGIVAGLALLYGSFLESNNKLKEYKRKLEQTSVSADCDSSKIGVLEAKIEVLEKALKTALENNND